MINEDDMIRQALSRRSERMEIPTGWEDGVLDKIEQRRNHIAHPLKVAGYLAIACSFVAVFVIGFVWLNDGRHTDNIIVEVENEYADVITTPKDEQGDSVVKIPPIAKPMKQTTFATVKREKASQPQSAIVDDEGQYEIIMPEIEEPKPTDDFYNLDASEYIAMVISRGESKSPKGNGAVEITSGQYETENHDK